ncbi:MAG: N-acetylneuraminate synthase family protein [Minisyncoccales bacterium]
MISLKIGNKLIGDSNPCFIIAEAGVNHNGDFDLAIKLIDAAKAAGVDAVKFQTFKAEEIVIPDTRQADYQSKNIGKVESQYKMLKRLELSYGDFRGLKAHCDRVGIIFMSTPHSCRDDVDLVAELCPAIKVGSGDLTNKPMLEYMASKGLPMIIATGMATMEEAKEAAGWILPINPGLVVLHCSTDYPTPLNEVNLRAIQTIQNELGVMAGYSDHTEEINVSLAAVALGARVIEKHFTLNKTMSGPDHKASLEPDELKALVDGVREVEKRIAQGQPAEKIIRELNIDAALGNGIKIPTPSEIETAKVARKSIVAAGNISSGQTIIAEMLAIKRPGTGMQPKLWNCVVGKRALVSIADNQLISPEMLDT